MVLLHSKIVARIFSRSRRKAKTTCETMPKVKNKDLRLKAKDMVN